MDTEPIKTDDSVDVLKNLESLIKSALSGVDKKKAELKKLQEMVTDFLSQDETYQAHEQAAKEASPVKNATKSQLLKQPSVAANVVKAKELKGEVKEQQNELSDYLREYHRMSGSNEIEDDNGDVQEIVYVAKLVKRSAKFK